MLALSTATGVNASEFLSKIFGVGGIAFGFAAQQTVSNLISGMMLLLSQPFVIGDHIEAAGVSGWVLEVGLLHTFINTDEHVRVMMPNAKVINSPIVNNSQLAARLANVSITIPEAKCCIEMRKLLQEAAEEVEAEVKKLVQSKIRSGEGPNDAKAGAGKNWRPGGVYGRGRPLHALKGHVVEILEMMPKEKVIKWNVGIWAPSEDVFLVKDKLFDAVLKKLRGTGITAG